MTFSKKVNVLVPQYFNLFFSFKRCARLAISDEHKKQLPQQPVVFFSIRNFFLWNGWKLSIEGNVGKIRVKRVWMNEIKKTTFKFTLRNQHLNIRYIYLLLHICMWFARFQMKIYVVVSIYFFLFSNQTQIAEKHLWRINSMENSWYTHSTEYYGVPTRNKFNHWTYEGIRTNWNLLLNYSMNYENKTVNFFFCTCYCDHSCYLPFPCLPLIAQCYLFLLYIYFTKIVWCFTCKTFSVDFSGIQSKVCIIIFRGAFGKFNGTQFSLFIQFKISFEIAQTAVCHEQIRDKSASFKLKV